MKSFFLAFFWVIVGVFCILYLVPHTETNPFLDYYRVENAVAVSPHDLRMEMDKWLTDTIIVDLRSAWEYATEHIRWAINIPGIANDADAKAQEARIIAAFAKLPKNKRIIVHCYTHYCMLAKHVWLILAEKGIYVHELNIGWNEWRYQWDLWNGEGTSKSVDVSNYLEWSAVTHSWSASSTGSLMITPCTVNGLAGC